MSLAQEIGKAYKKGDINKCVDAMGSQSNRINYCVSSFADDFTNLNYCKNTEEFCELCCGTEFGEMLSNDKDKCIEKVCPSKDKKKEDDGETGRWIVQPQGNWVFQKGLEAPRS